MERVGISAPARMALKGKAAMRRNLRAAKTKARMAGDNRELPGTG